MDISGRIKRFTEITIETLNSKYVNTVIYLFFKILLHTLPPFKKISLEYSLKTCWLNKGLTIYGEVVKYPVLDIGTSERYYNFNNNTNIEYDTNAFIHSIKRNKYHENNNVSN